MDVRWVGNGGGQNRVAEYMDCVFFICHSTQNLQLLCCLSIEGFVAKGQEKIIITFIHLFSA